MFWVYILLSEKQERYYIGHTSDPDRRLVEHNTDERDKYTSKYRPWVMAFRYPVSEIRSEAIIIEKYLKGRKSKQLLEKLISKEPDRDYIKTFFAKVLSKKH
jgi:putative endonuclease